MKGLIWLASYPRSGNTWVRLVLSRCLDPAGSFDFAPSGSSIAASRSVLETCLGIETDHLTSAELNALLPKAYEAWAVDPVLPKLVKNHGAFLRLEDGLPIYPPEYSRGVVHVVRDPRDVAISLAAHLGVSPDKAIDRMNNPDFTLAHSPSARLQIPQLLLDWSLHTQSWMNAPMPRLVVPYERLLTDTLETFAEIARFCAIETAGSGLAEAVANCSFRNLQELEKRSGFAERPTRSSSQFFREGRSGIWKEALSAAQIERIERKHAPVMKELGYALSTD